MSSESEAFTPKEALVAAEQIERADVGCEDPQTCSECKRLAATLRRFSEMADAVQPQAAPRERRRKRSQTKSQGSSSSVSAWGPRGSSR